MDKDQPQETGDMVEIKTGEIKVEKGGILNIAGRDIIQIINNFLQLDTEQQRAYRNRQNMLQLVWNTWIEGVLKKSLYNEVLIELDMETKPDAVEHPWDMILHMPEQEPQLIPPKTRMLELCDAMNGSMLILGEPGSGKTTMLLELCRQAIERAKIDTSQPIPVVFNLSSWTPKQTLAGWLIDELQRRYYINQKIAKTWIDQDDLMLLLDGLDEVPVENRATIGSAINTFIEKHKVSIIVCSRREEYEQLFISLKFYGALLIRPLSNQQVNDYLQIVVPGLSNISNELQQDHEFQNFAKTPLALNIVVLALRNSTEDLGKLTQTDDFRKCIFDTYIKQMFKRNVSGRLFPPEKSKVWLSWLAQRMFTKGITIFFIEDLQASWIPNRKEQKQVELFEAWWAGLIFGLLSCFLMIVLSNLFVSGPIPWYLYPLTILGWPLVLSLFTFTEISPEIEHKIYPALKLGWSWKKVKESLSMSLAAGIVVGLFGIFYYSIEEGIKSGILVGLGYGLIVILLFLIIISLTEGLGEEKVEITQQPGKAISLSLLNHVISSLIYGSLLGIFFGPIAGFSLKYLPLFQYKDIHYSILQGSIIGFCLGILWGSLAHGSFYFFHHFIRWQLFRTGNLPWNYLGFLEYCTRSIFLRRVGGGYIFIHRMLMEHFAAMWAEKSTKEKA